MLIGDPGEQLDAPGNTIPGGVVTDVSFVGVSTQYLVRMPWGQELQVFEQNTGHRRLFRTGESVELSWRPSTRSSSTTARTLRPARTTTEGERLMSARSPRPRLRRASRARLTGYLLLLPGVAWLLLFFVIPFYSLVADQPLRPGRARTSAATT